MLKNRLKALLFLVIVLAQGFIFIPQRVLADDYQLSNFANVAGYSTTDPSQTTLIGLSQNVIKAVLSIVGIVFLGFALYAGIRWMTAQGNEENVTKSKDTLQAAIIGMIIIALSYAITTLVFGLLQKPVVVKQSAPPSPFLSCSVDADCPLSQKCYAAVCKPVSAIFTACTQDTDCNSGTVCVANVCTVKPNSSSCVQDTDCGINQVCVASTCWTPPPKTCSSNGDCTGGQVCDTGSCVAANFTNCALLGANYTWDPVAGKCSTGVAQIGQSCVNDANCASGHCSFGKCVVQAIVCSDPVAQCGGGCSSQCNLGGACNVDQDCFLPYKCLSNKCSQ